MLPAPDAPPATATGLPEGVPQGLTFWFQALVQDAGAVQGVAISNGLGAVTP